MIIPVFLLYHPRVHTFSTRMQLGDYVWTYGVWTDLGRYRLWPVYAWKVSHNPPGPGR